MPSKTFPERLPINPLSLGCKSPHLNPQCRLSLTLIPLHTRAAPRMEHMVSMFYSYATYNCAIVQIFSMHGCLKCNNI